MLLGHGFMRDKLVRFGGYPTHGDVADMSNLFYFYFVFILIKGHDALTEISPFKAK